MELRTCAATPLTSNTFSIFGMVHVILSATIFFELLVGILYMAALISSLEIVRLIQISFSRKNKIQFRVFVQAIQNLDPKIFMIILGLPMSTGTVFLYCYVGSLTTEQFSRYATIPYESDWLMMPLQLQKFLLIIVAEARRPVEFSGLGLFSLNLMAFGKVWYEFKLYICDPDTERAPFKV